MHNIFALPAELGGLGIKNPATLSSKEFPASEAISATLRDIESQQVGYLWETIDAQQNAKKVICKLRQAVSKASAAKNTSALSASFIPLIWPK